MIQRDQRRWLLALGACFLLVFVQVLGEHGPLIGFDRAVGGLALEERWPHWYPLAKAFELLGRRALVYLVAAAIAGGIAWSARDWRPVLVLGATLLALNVVVGGTKILTGRPKPATGELALFEGGTMFPSGHAVNVVVAWGLVAYLLVRYRPRDWPVRWMAVGVALASIAMGAASVYLNTHWVTDLVAGWILGALLLQAAVILDGVVAPGQALRSLRPRRTDRAADHATPRAGPAVARQEVVAPHSSGDTSRTGRRRSAQPVGRTAPR